ncbi:MAG TPA: AcvB/VirJ family lysyl-phosphatidylglycerol hydrolase [Spongiibacteraceae bacterium]
MLQLSLINRVITLGFCALAAISLHAESVRSDHEDFADLGTVEIFSPTTAPNDLLLLMDDSSASPALARQLAEQHHLVALMPLKHLLDNSRKHRDDCIYPVTLLDVYSQHLQQKYRLAHYQKPVLIGTGQAAAMIYATLAQAPTRLFRAGIGIDFCPTLSLPAPPCTGDGNLRADLIDNGAPQKFSTDHAYHLQPVALRTPWHMIDTAAPACVRDGFPTGVIAQRDLAAQIGALIPPEPQLVVNAAKNATRIDDLPLVELPAANSNSDFLVVFLSGDGGWANIDKDIGSLMSSKGIPVVGWNTLQYFWNRKTPEIAAADLQRVIAHYQQVWKKQRVVLIGFSFGADVLPFMIDRLPAEQRAQIVDIALLSLSHSVDFEFHVSAWLGSNGGDTHQIAPELKKISGPVLCIYGTEDDDTLCKDFKAPNITERMLPGDHHFGGDFGSATKLILEHVQKNSMR